MIRSSLLDDRVGRTFESGDSRRVIKEIDECHTDQRLQVIYSLYRKEVLWSQDPAKRGRVEWRYLREGYCSMKTFKRWLKGAQLVK